eukprot:3392235-Rhodomonas_salina.1
MVSGSQCPPSSAPRSSLQARSFPVDLAGDDRRRVRPQGAGLVSAVGEQVQLVLPINPGRHIHLNVGKALHIRRRSEAGERPVHLLGALPEAVAHAPVAHVDLLKVRVVLPLSEKVVRVVADDGDDAAELDLGALLLPVQAELQLGSDVVAPHVHAELALCHGQQLDVLVVVPARESIHLDVDPEALSNRDFPEQALLEARTINADPQAVGVGRGLVEQHVVADVVRGREVDDVDRKDVRGAFRDVADGGQPLELQANLHAMHRPNLAGAHACTGDGLEVGRPVLLVVPDLDVERVAHIRVAQREGHSLGFRCALRRLRGLVDLGAHLHPGI